MCHFYCYFLIFFFESQLLLQIINKICGVFPQEVRGLELWNGEKKLHVTLEAGDLSGGEKIILGLNLFEPLGYQIQNIPILLPTAKEEVPKVKEKNSLEQSLLVLN